MNELKYSIPCSQLGLAFLGMGLLLDAHYFVFDLL